MFYLDELLQLGVDKPDGEENRELGAAWKVGEDGVVDLVEEHGSVALLCQVLVVYFVRVVNYNAHHVALLALFRLFI